VLFVAVRDDGTVLGSQAPTVVTHQQGSGDYVVFFNQGVVQGVAVATPEIFPGGGSLTAGAVAQITMGFNGAGNVIDVRWTAPSGSVDTSFGLIVAL
jgi:hypothetical protein